MILVQDVLISDDIISENFICNLNACKGACCYEGDYGAPVTKEEEELMTQHKKVIAEYLPQESKDLLQSEGVSQYFEEPKFQGTTLHPDGACVFMYRNEIGMALCGIEKAYKDGNIPMNKPRSCHLYPIRVVQNPEVGFEAWNYDRWDICSAACDLGNKESVPIYVFLKDSIIAYKGEDFYEELDAAAQHMKSTSS